MKIVNVRYFGEDGKFHKGEVSICDGRFTSVNETDDGGRAEKENIKNNAASKNDEQVVDGQGAYMIPGLVDIHFHGCMGADLCDASEEGLQKMADYEASCGVTTICPASMTIAEDELMKVMEMAGNFASKEGAHFVGVNMEGPFISEAKKGAQAAENIKKCDVELFRRYQSAAKGKIKLVDIAPEEEGAMEFIDELKDEVVISLAHTMADYDTSMEAFKRGAKHATHLYNAMPPLHHRDPGVIGAARDTKKCHVELICDGVHIHPAMIRATFAMFGKERMILISDSMRATGLEDGSYTLGGQDVTVKGSYCTLADGTIAGSATNLMDCMRYAIKEAKIPMEDAIMAATINPAKEIGVGDVCGSIAVGKQADFVLLDEDLKMKAVYLMGKQEI